MTEPTASTVHPAASATTETASATNAPPHASSAANDSKPSTETAAAGAISAPATHVEAQVATTAVTESNANPAVDTTDSSATVTAMAARTTATQTGLTVAQVVPSPTAAVTDPVSIVVGSITGFINAILSPLAVGGPAAPDDPPTMWTLLAWVRRELFGPSPTAPPTVNVSLADPSSTGPITVADQPLASPPATVAPLTTEAQQPVTYTGEPSLVHDLMVFQLRVLKVVSQLFGGGLSTSTNLLSSTTPPWFFSLGLNVHLLSPDTLRLQDQALSDGADITFALRKGRMHTYDLLSFLPEAQADRPSIYRFLLGSDPRTL